MLNTQPVSGILEYLLQTHNPRAIIITGSYADGTYNEASDFDCWLIGRDESRAYHDTSIVNGIQLHAEIYPLSHLMHLPMRMIEFFIDVIIAHDPDGAAAEFMNHVQKELACDPCMRPEKKAQTMAYLEKMLRRASRQDFNGDLRGHLMLFQSVEYWCDFSDRIYQGSKKTLRMMEKTDPKSAAILRRAMRSFDPADMQAWIDRLRTVYGQNSGRKYRIL